MKNKKIIAIIGVVVAAALIVGAYFAFWAPKSQEGVKQITVTVVKDGETTLEKNYKTDKEFVAELIDEKKEELGATIAQSTYGSYIEGMNGYIADTTKNEYYAFYVDDEYAAFGISETPIVSGQTYSFRLETY